MADGGTDSQLHLCCHACGLSDMVLGGSVRAGPDHVWDYVKGVGTHLHHVHPHD